MTKWIVKIYFSMINIYFKFTIQCLCLTLKLHVNVFIKKKPCGGRGHYVLLKTLHEKNPNHFGQVLICITAIIEIKVDIA